MEISLAHLRCVGTWIFPVRLFTPESCETRYDRCVSGTFIILVDCSIILAGTNVTIECLEQTLHRLQQDGVKLPPHLNLQLDNTSKQNKNRSFLVLHQIF